MTIIHGAVHVMISVAKVEMDCARLSANRPTKMKAIDRAPMKNVAWTRLKRVNTLETSSPVPYSAVVPVERPPIRAIRQSGRKYQPGEMASSPPT